MLQSGKWHFLLAQLSGLLRSGLLRVKGAQIGIITCGNITFGIVTFGIMTSANKCLFVIRTQTCQLHNKKMIVSSGSLPWLCMVLSHDFYLDQMFLNKLAEEGRHNTR